MRHRPPHCTAAGSKLRTASNLVDGKVQRHGRLAQKSSATIKLTKKNVFYFLPIVPPPPTRKRSKVCACLEGRFRIDPPSQTLPRFCATSARYEFRRGVSTSIRLGREHRRRPASGPDAGDAPGSAVSWQTHLGRFSTSFWRATANAPVEQRLLMPRNASST